MRIIYVITFILCPLFLFSKESDVFHHPKFQKLDLWDGLSNLNVSDIIQDDLGYIWISTARGLNRYDGTSFEHFLFSENEHALYNDMTYELHLCSRGNIFCSSTGVNMFDTQKDKMHKIGIDHGSFVDFIEYDGITYGVSVISGLCKFNSADHVFEKLPHVKNDLLFDFLVTVEGSGIWGKSNDHLVNYNPHTNQFNRYELPHYARSTINNGPMEIIDSILLITGDTFTLFNTKSNTFESIPQNWDQLNYLYDKEIRTMKRVDQKTIWFGTRTKGLFIFDLETNSLLNLNKSNSEITSNFINCIFKDQDNNIWVGTFDHGISVAFKDRGNVNYDNALNTIADGKFVNSITSDNKGNYYIGTRFDGLYSYNSISQEIKNYTSENSFLSSDHIRTLFIDSENKFWIGGKKALHITDLKTEKVEKFIIEGINEGMGDFSENAGKIFACSDYQGFFIFNLNGKLIRHEPRLGSIISQIIPINENEILVASYTEGVFKYNINDEVAENIYNINNLEKNTVNQIITMFLDNQNVLWIGNYASGLHKLDMNTGESSIYTMKDGLPNNDIVGIVEDESGALWLSTSYGISRFNKKKEFVNFFHNEGLNNLQFHAKAAHIDKNGIVFFCGNNGLTYFNPNTLYQSFNRKESDIILKSLTVDNNRIFPDDETGILTQILNSTQSITLNHKQNVVTIEYHAFDYVAANEIKYEYILEGLNSEWNKVGKRTYANFSNLKPGNYTFKVKAQNNKGIWSKEASLDIKINSSPYLTTWAFIIYFILATAIINVLFFMIMRARLLKNKLDLEHIERVRENEVSQMKMRFFTNISHEIRTPLTLIKGNIDLLSKELGESHHSHSAVNGIKYSTDRLLALVNQLLSFRKLENDALDLKIVDIEIISLAQKLILPHAYVASNRNITINVESRIDKLIMPLDTDKFDKIISNLISNSIKHSKENGFITIKIELANNEELKAFENELDTTKTSYAKISVIDNGSGISKHDLPNIFERYKQSETDRKKQDYSGTGIGLNFTRRLIELHKGKITVISDEEQTCFSIYLPIDKAIFDKACFVENNLKVNGQNQITIKESIDSDTLQNQSDVILIAEDDLELNRFLKTALEKYFKVITTYNGKEGLLHAKTHLPSLIISDIMMPEMDGYEMCHAIRNDEIISHLPVILLTAKADSESKIEGFLYGADEYISKPFELEVLLARINNLLSQRKRLQKSYRLGIVTDKTDDIKNPYELKFIKQIESVVTKNYHDPDFNVNELAKQMNMSRASFYRKFMNIMKISPKDFITKFRINHSIEFIKNGDENFTEISQKCGFNSLSVFSTVFKKEQGITPMQFKQSL